MATVAQNDPHDRPWSVIRRLHPPLAAAFLCLLLAFGIPAFAQELQTALSPPPQSALLPQQESPGSIRGTVVDQTGVPVTGARVRLTIEEKAFGQETFSDEEGHFSFANVPPGSFQLAVSSEGLAPQTASGIFHSGESYVVPQVALVVASASMEVRVSLSTLEIAEGQIKDQEKQRVLGFVPNFYVTYVHDAAPLSPKQKFELAWKSTLDPISFGVNGGLAGVQQAQNDFSGYGQGAQGYTRRLGASFADSAVGTFLGSAVVPSLLKQDPRYFYKGGGGRRSRLLYAIANAVICKGDNGRWQANYSNVVGSLAAGGVSNLYYPDTNRGARLTFENAGIALAASAGVNVLQEFVIRKLTPKTPPPDPAIPQ